MDMKDYRRNELKFYVFGNIVMILLFSGFLDSIVGQQDSSNIIVVIKTLLGSSVVFSLVYVYTYIIDSFIPANLKDGIIYFLFGRPGDTVFSDIRNNNKDSRFTKEQAMSLYDEIYKRMNALVSDKKALKNFENSSWFKIYRKHQSDGSVETAQKDFLLNRDMCIMTLIILGIYILLVLFGVFACSCKIITILLAQVLLIYIAANLKAMRFVNNVIANDVSDSNKKSNSTNNKDETVMIVTIKRK